jgi:transposase
MEITAAQFSRIESLLPLQRGNVSVSNLQVVNAILYVAEHGCKWRGLPKRFGNWHTILHTNEPLGESRCVGSVVRRIAASAAHPSEDRGRQPRQHHRESTSGRHRRSKKTDPSRSVDLAADGRRRFIWLPRMLERL